MKPTNLRKSILIFNMFLFILGSFLIPPYDVFSQPGMVVATTTISNSTPEIGDQVTVTVSIDMSAVPSPDNKLGSYTALMQWNTSVLSYVSNSGATPTGFTGVVNAANAATGKINFNGANAAGVSGVTAVIAITFNVIGAGNALLDLDFSAMAAATTYNSLLGILTINEGTIVVEGGETGVAELDGAVSSGTVNNASSLSFSHTTGTGNNRLTMVGISWNSGTAAKTISSVKFIYEAGLTEIAFTEVITEEVNVSGTVSGPRYAAIYRSSAQPPVGTTGTITVTFSTTVENGVVAGAANFKGVDQTTPLGTPLGAHATSTNSSPSLTLSGLSGKELIFDTVFLGGQDNTYTLSVGADQTQHWNDFLGNTRGTASTEQAAGSSVTMSWTPTTQNWWAQVAVPINPAADTPLVCYSLTLTSGVNGTSPTANPTQSTGCDAGKYTAGQLINLTAHPASGYQVASWSGTNDDVLKTLTNTVTMPAAARTVNVTYGLVPVVTIVELDGAVSSSTGNNASSLTFSHTTGSGDNRMTLAGISWNAGDTEKTISSVKFSYGEGSTEIAFTEVITEAVTVSGSVSGSRYAAIYRSSAQPPVGTTGTITVTFNTSVTNGVVAGAANFKGVDQTTPLGTPVGAHATSASSSPSLTLPGLSGKELIFDTVFLGGQDNTYTFSVGADQTQHWNDFLGNTRGTASTEQAAGTSVTMSWTAPTQNWWAQVAVPINPVAASNQAPTLNPVGNKSITVGSTLSFTATAYDDGLPSGMLTFSLEGGLSGSVPAGAEIVAATGIFSWTPSIVGNNTFDVCVSDGALKDCETITVIVTPNIPPPTQSSFYGEIHYQLGDGEPQVGDYVEAHIAGITGYVNRTAILDTGDSLVFLINVDGDDLGTPEKDGGIENDVVIFMINGRVVAKGTWLDMENTEINIHPPKAEAGDAYAVLLEDASIGLAGSVADWLMPDTFTYEWDFDEDDNFDDATGQTPTFAFTEAGTHVVELKVTDGQGGEGFDETPLFVVDLDGLEDQFYNGSPHPVTAIGVDAPYTTTIWYGDQASTIPPTLTGTYPVVVQIKQGDAVIAVIEVELVIAGAIHEIDLVAGWNLVSYNVIPTSSAIDAVLASIDGSYSLVYAWDVSGAHNNTGNWVRFDPSVPYGNTLTTLDAGMGFWIFMEEADVLTVVGTYQTVSTIPLKISVGGWNLVGYPSADNLALPGALSDNGITDFSLIFAYKAADTSDPWKLFDPTVAPVLNDLTQMSPGWGYWIFVTEDSDWQVAY